jgi:membrane-associated phospholipid phosphatase
MDGRTKAVWSTLFVLGFGLAYLLPNRFPTGEPRSLPLTDWERSLPLVPWTFVVYMSDYLLGAWAVWQVRRERDFLELARVATLALVLCASVFYLFPTSYPRPPYPETDSLLIGGLMRLLAAADQPNCAFPSMHVALTGACVWGLRRSVPPWAVPLTVLWGVAIAVSTLTTKQHYLWDVLGGAFVFAIAVLLDCWLERRYGARAWPGWLFVGGLGPAQRTPLPRTPERVLPNGDRGVTAESPTHRRSGNAGSTRAR